MACSGLLCNRGTISGIGKYLKEKNPEVKVVAVEPASSPVLSTGKGGAHKIQGIGAGFVPETLDTKIYDEIITVENELYIYQRLEREKRCGKVEKIDDLKVIINDEENKELVRLIKKELKELIREITPVKYDINVRYGCEEPYMTGRILGVIAVIYGITGVQFNITPEFEQKVLEGDIYMKGRVRIYRLLLIALRVYKNNRFRKLVFNKG